MSDHAPSPNRALSTWLEGPVAALSGGIGGAKLALGFSWVRAPGTLTVVANTGDDFERLGLHASALHCVPLLKQTIVDREQLDVTTLVFAERLRADRRRGGEAGQA